MNKQKICIIGGGLTGFVTATILSELNIDIDLITGKIGKNSKSNRTTAISHSNYENLIKFKNFKFLKKYTWPSSKMELYTENNYGAIYPMFELDLDKTKNIKIFYMIKNSIIKKNIQKHKK